MARIHSRDTTPEIAIRKLLHGLGYRYRLHHAKLPGKPDIVFARRRKVIFVHGCFWHQHSDPHCKIVRQPKSGTSYWSHKLARNLSRDAERLSQLRRLGWTALVIWECWTRDPEMVQQRIVRFLGPTRQKSKF